MDAVLYWNRVALDAVRTTATTLNPLEEQSSGPVGSARALAIVHLAMHDAHFTINPAAHGPYLTMPPNPMPGADVDAAIAAAAHACLTELFPAQKASFDDAHQNAGLNGSGVGKGHAHGLAIAQQILAARASDPGVGDEGYAGSVARYAHRPDPSNPTQGFYAPNYGSHSSCFAATKRFTLVKPPTGGDPLYTRAFQEVQAKGITPELMGTLPAGAARRTAEETLIGVFWAYDDAKKLGNPPRLYNQILRKIAIHRNNNLQKNARLFALVNVALADAGILSWDEKYFHNLWRPVLGVREHDESMGFVTQPTNALDAGCDPNWLPLGAQRTNQPGRPNFTPPFPSYPSGHATLGSAAFQTIRRFYGVHADGPDNLLQGLSFVSDEWNGTNTDNNGVVRSRHERKYPRGLWQMIEENGRSRVYLGVHWVFDAFAVDAAGKMDLSQNIGGVPLGLNVANDLHDNGLKASAAAPPRLP